MSTLKNNIDNIAGDTEKIARDYLKLLVVKSTERLALFFGILATVFLLVTLLLIVIVIGSVALSGYLNEVLDSGALGYWIVAGIYVLFITLLLIRMLRSKTPLFANLFVRLIVFILDVDIRQGESLQGLKTEKESIHEQLDTHREKMKTDFQLLRYTFLEGLLKEFLGLFARKKKKSSPGAKTKAKTGTKAKSKRGAKEKAKPDAQQNRDAEKDAD